MGIHLSLTIRIYFKLRLLSDNISFSHIPAPFSIFTFIVYSPAKYYNLILTYKQTRSLFYKNLPLSFPITVPSQLKKDRHSKQSFSYPTSVSEQSGIHPDTENKDSSQTSLLKTGAFHPHLNPSRKHNIHILRHIHNSRSIRSLPSLS